MQMAKCTILKLFIVLISLFIIDGGSSFYLLSNNVQVILTRDHIADSELPNQHNLSDFYEDEKWLGSISCNYAAFSTESTISLFNQNIVSYELLDAVWQPPRFV
jgi:hypothetical protein